MVRFQSHQEPAVPNQNVVERASHRDAEAIGRVASPRRPSDAVEGRGLGAAEHGTVSYDEIEPPSERDDPARDRCDDSRFGHCVVIELPQKM
jgi:hypothetical protein